MPDTPEPSPATQRWQGAYNTVRTVGAFKKKNISISLAGTETPIFLLDESAVVVKVTPTTTAGAAAIAIREQLGLKHDKHYAIFEYYDGMFRFIEDNYPLAKIIQKWQQDSVSSGPRKLCYKRYMRVPASKTEQEEESAQTANVAAHRLTFVDCVYQYLHGRYRFDTPLVVALTVLLLQSTKGNYDRQSDNVRKIRQWIEHICPVYAILDLPLDHPRSYGVGKSPSALSAEELADRVHTAYASGGIKPVFAAQREFMRLCKEYPAYGYESFFGTRTWKEMEQQPDGTMKDVTRNEDVCVCIGYDGITLLGMTENPLEFESNDYSDIGKWTTSKDGKIFAYSVDDDKIVYILTDVASYIVKTIEDHVEEKVRILNHDPANPDPATPDPDSSSVPRNSADSGIGTIPVIAGILPPPTPFYVDAATGVSSPASSSTAAALSSATAAVAASRATAAAAAASAAAAGPAAGQPVAAASNASAAEQELPPGWVQIRTDAGDAYYFHLERQLSQWERPAAATAAGGVAALAGPLPDGWRCALDQDTGEPYYYNEDTDETTWEKPEFPEENLAPGWKVLKDAEGDIYFWEVATGACSWDKPKLIDGEVRFQKPPMPTSDDLTDAAPVEA